MNMPQVFHGIENLCSWLKSWLFSEGNSVVFHDTLPFESIAIIFQAASLPIDSCSFLLSVGGSSVLENYPGV